MRERGGETPAEDGVTAVRYESPLVAGWSINTLQQVQLYAGAHLNIDEPFNMTNLHCGRK